MTSDALQSILPRLRGSESARVTWPTVARDSLRIGSTALRGIAVFAAVFGAVGGIIFALALLCLTTVAMLGLFGGAFAAVPLLHTFAGK